MAEGSTTLQRLFAAADGLFPALALAGAFAAGTGWRGGAYLMLAGLVGAVAAHVGIGIAAYRRVMRRPWPQVQPLPDDDDW